MAHAETCPVCMGRGKVKNPDYNLNATYPGPEEVICYGCGGRGWVSVGTEYPRETK